MTYTDDVTITELNVFESGSVSQQFGSNKGTDTPISLSAEEDYDFFGFAAQTNDQGRLSALGVVMQDPACFSTYLTDYKVWKEADDIAKAAQVALDADNIVLADAATASQNVIVLEKGEVVQLE